MLGLIAYDRAFPSRRVKSYIRKFAAGLMTMQDGSARRAPYGLHRSWESTWHMWGNSQTAALAAAGRHLHDARMIRSAEREARGFYARLLIDGFMKETDLADPSKRRVFEQIAYAVRPMATGLLRCYDATGDSLYLSMAGLAASWLLGNNCAGAVMYDTATGRCFDGIRDSTSVNRNAGAESTIEALLTIVELSPYPEAARELFCRRIGTAGTAGAADPARPAKSSKPAVQRADFILPGGRIVTLSIDPRSGKPSIAVRPETPPP